MDLSRREFIATTAAALAATKLPAAISPAPESFERESIAWIQGDFEARPSGESFEDAFDFAMRYRTQPEERDRYVLGLEL